MYLKRKLLIERPEIAIWRMRYMNYIRKYREEDWNIDETYIQQSHSVKKCWQSEGEVGLLSDIGKGDRLIVHGGGEGGFVEGAL